MRVELLQPGMAEAYDYYLLGHSSSLLYHSFKYKEFLKKLIGCEEHYLVAMEGTQIHGVLPLMYSRQDSRYVYNSLPYYGSNGSPIADDAKTYRGLINAYNEIATSATTVSSTVIGNPFGSDDMADLSYAHNYSDHRIGQFTDIECQHDPWDEIMTRLDGSARRNIKKAISEGVTVEIDHTQMHHLQRMHEAGMRAINGNAKTDGFFKSVPDCFDPGKDYDLYLAKKDGVIIAGLLVFFFNQTVEYYTPATDPQYRSLDPSSVCLIHAMVDASRRGFVRWNWGGTWESQAGVYRFKKKWGSRERNYHYYIQLNDLSVLEWPQEKILNAFPGFYVVPFSELRQKGVDTHE